MCTRMCKSELHIIAALTVIRARNRFNVSARISGVYPGCNGVVTAEVGVGEGGRAGHYAVGAVKEEGFAEMARNECGRGCQVNEFACVAVAGGIVRRVAYKTGGHGIKRPIG